MWEESIFYFNIRDLTLAEDNLGVTFLMLCIFMQSVPPSTALITELPSTVQETVHRAKAAPPSSAPPNTLMPLLSFPSLTPQETLTASSFSSVYLVSVSMSELSLQHRIDQRKDKVRKE